MSTASCREERVGRRAVDDPRGVHVCRVVSILSLRPCAFRRFIQKGYKSCEPKATPLILSQISRDMQIKGSELREISRPSPHLLSERARQTAPYSPDAGRHDDLRRVMHQLVTSSPAGVEIAVLEVRSATFAPPKESASDEPLTLQLNASQAASPPVAYGMQLAKDAVASYLRSTLSLMYPQPEPAEVSVAPAPAVDEQPSPSPAQAALALYEEMRRGWSSKRQPFSAEKAAAILSGAAAGAPPLPSAVAAPSTPPPPLARPHTVQDLTAEDDPPLEPNASTTPQELTQRPIVIPTAYYEPPVAAMQVPAAAPDLVAAPPQAPRSSADAAAETAASRDAAATAQAKEDAETRAAFDSELGAHLARAAELTRAIASSEEAVASLKTRPLAMGGFALPALATAKQSGSSIAGHGVERAAQFRGRAGRADAALVA